jgi:hypothetical protein
MTCAEQACLPSLGGFIHLFALGFSRIHHLPFDGLGFFDSLNLRLKYRVGLALGLWWWRRAGVASAQAQDQRDQYVFHHVFSNKPVVRPSMLIWFLSRQ